MRVSDLVPAGVLAAAGLSRLSSLPWGRYRRCLAWTLVLASAPCQGNRGLTVGMEPAVHGAGAGPALPPGVCGWEG